jgi:hypothetical protein
MWRKISIMLIDPWDRFGSLLHDGRLHRGRLLVRPCFNLT